MKITEVKTIVTCPGRNFVIVKIETDEGFYGLGESTLNGRELAVASALKDHVGPALIGKDPDRIEDTWQELFRGTYWRGGPVLQSALSGVDMALWDIKGKRAGLPVYSLLGGATRDKVWVYRCVGGNTFQEVLDACERLMKEGCRFINVHDRLPIPGQRPGVWDPEVHIRIIPDLFKFLREQLGENVNLMHDVHERIGLNQACRLAKSLEPYNLFFLEDPLRPEYKESFRMLRSATTTPLAMGELYMTIWECLPLIREQLVDYLRVDLTHFGGITAGKKLAVLAEPYYVNMVFHGPSDMTCIGHAANAHVDMSIPNFGVQEYFIPSEEILEVQRKVFWGGPVFKNGYVTVPDEPGLGVYLDEEEAKKHPYKSASLPVLRLEDGSVTDW